jgi:uncharacterized glyoxalase superfamily protein PhnB
VVSNPSVRVAHHLTFAGECEEAFELYSQILGGTILGVQKYADSPWAHRFRRTGNKKCSSRVCR